MPGGPDMRDPARDKTDSGAWLDVLVNGERLLWSGRPAGGILLRQIEIVLIPSSLFWGGFAVFWNVSAWTMAGSGEFMLFGVPFLLMAAYITVGRFVHDVWLRRRTHYAVTNERVIVRRTGLGGTVRSLDLAALPVLELQEGTGGRGTIRFESRPWFGGAGFDIWVPGLAAAAQFLRIPDARSVYALIRAQRSRGG